MTTGLRGLVVLGSNGEAAFIDDDESERMVGEVRALVPRERLLIAGTGRDSTRATIDACRRAGRVGADFVLVRTPTAFKAQLTPEAFVRHFTAVADASPVPVLLYDFPQSFGVTLPLPVIVEAGGAPERRRHEGVERGRRADRGPGVVARRSASRWWSARRRRCTRACSSAPSAASSPWPT